MNLIVLGRQVNKDVHTQWLKFSYAGLVCQERVQEKDKRK